MKNRPVAIALVISLIAFASGCRFEVVSVEPNQLTLFGHQVVKIKGSGFQSLSEGSIEVRFGGVEAVNVAIESDDTIACIPQGSAVPGPVDVEVKDTGALGSTEQLADALEYIDTPYPQFRNIYNFGPSLSAGVVDMGFDPPGQINSVPGFIARQLGAYFPQRIVLAGGIPPLDSPNQVSHLFIGDGVRSCTVPATGQTYVPAPGELCNPVVVGFGGIPILDMVKQLLPAIIDGILSGDGLASGIFQDPKIENRNYAVPGAQMIDFSFGTRTGFNYLQDFFLDPATGLRNPVCLGEPVISRIARRSPPADLVVGFDWFFDSVLFSHPPEQDLLHQILFAMLVLVNGSFYDGLVGPAGSIGTCDGTWNVPLISTDGTRTRTTQPFQGFPEVCDPNLACDVGAAGADRGDARILAQALDFGEPKRGYVVDWFRLGLIPQSADTNGNGTLDIDYHDPSKNELTAPIVAAILAADDPSDNPTAVVFSTMPWPAASPSGQGGGIGGDDDQFAETVNVGVRGLTETFRQAFTLAGRADNLVVADTIEYLQNVFEGNRRDLTHEMDGDPATIDLYYEYELDPNGKPVKRGFLEYGGAFSLDHLHMSETMNAAVANLIIEAMNTQLGLSIPSLDLPSVWRADPYNHLEYDPSIQCAYTGFHCP